MLVSSLKPCYIQTIYNSWISFLIHAGKHTLFPLSA